MHILIIIMISVVPTVSHVPFKSKEACVKAANAVRHSLSFDVNRSTRVMCVEEK